MRQETNKHQFRHHLLHEVKASPKGACLYLFRGLFNPSKLRAFVVLPLLVAGLVVGILPSQTASAAYKDLDPSQQASSWMYYRAVHACINGMVSTVPSDPAAERAKATPQPYGPKISWFGDRVTDLGADTYVAPYAGNVSGKVSCAAAIETAAERYWGLSHLELLEGLGYVRERGSDGSEDHGSYQWRHRGVPQAEQLRTFLNSKGIGTTQTDADKYWIYLNAFNLSCSQTDGTLVSVRDMYTVTVDDGVQQGKSKAVKEKSKSEARFYTANGREEMFCSEDIAQALRDKKLADAYYLALLNHKCKQAGVASTGSQARVLLEACRAGIMNKGDESFCQNTYPRSSAQREACQKGQAIKLTANDLPDTKVDPDPEGEGGTMSSCRIEGIGWFLCPVLTFLAGVTDAAYSGVELLLTVPPMMVSGSSTEAVYIAWQAMRSIANVMFVIAFLVIIFSQLSSVGISNYGVKKTLPRLVVAAVLVNISFWICAVAVDLSNIVGSNMLGLFQSIGAGLKLPEVKSAGDWGGAATGEGWLGIVGAIISGGVIAASLVYLGLSALLPFILAAAFAILVVFIVLTIRQALIVLFIVIAPLAFVAYLLPNTEGLFHKWRKGLWMLLLMFPIIGVIFGASGLASQVVMNSSDNIFVQIAGAAMAIIPLALTWTVMKSTGGVLNKVGAWVNNPNRGPVDRMRKGAESFRKDRQNVRNMRALQGVGGLPGRNSFTRWRARRGAVVAGREAELNRAKSEHISDAMQNNGVFANAVAGGTSVFGQIKNDAGADATQRALASAINTTTKLELEEVTAASVVLKNAKLDQDAIRNLSNGVAVEVKDEHGNVKMTLNGKGAMRSAAIQQAVNSNDIAQINSLWNQAGSWGDSKEENSLRQTLADSLASSSARPGYIGQGALAGLRNGSQSTIEETIKDAVRANAYSPEKIVAADKDELKMVRETISGDSGVSDDQKQAFMLNAEKALTDENISVRISKNRDEIKNILGIT